MTTTCPRRQLIITIDRTSAIASDSHAPCSTLAMLEAKNATSTVRNRAAIGTSRCLDVPHRKRATARKSSVLRMNVPVTATPYVAQLVGGAEGERERDDADAQRPVDDRDVDLALQLRGMQDLEAGQEAQSDGLPCHGERARDRRLGGDDRRRRRQEQHRVPAPAGDQEEERVVGGARMVPDQDRLAEIVEHQGGEGDGEPAKPDRGGAEVPRSA